MLLLALDPFDKVINQNIQRFVNLNLFPLPEIIFSQEGTSAGVEKCEEDGKSQQTEGLHSDICKKAKWAYIRLALQI